MEIKQKLVSTCIQQIDVSITKYTNNRNFVFKGLFGQSFGG